MWIEMLTISRNFIPDAGRLIHLQTPKSSDSVRIDAGFVQGDDISSHYDPMIAKLIVGAPTRHEALLKLKMALEDYQVVGVTTNIDFLKRLSTHTAFMAGEVETGFIDKYRQDLFQEEPTEDEAFAQAALGLFWQDSLREAPAGIPAASVAVAGFGPGYQQRSFPLVQTFADTGANTSEVPVTIHQIGPDTFDVTVKGTHFEGVRSHLDRTSNIVTSFFLHTRIESKLVRAEDSITIFQRGKQYKFNCATPTWYERALGIRIQTNSVVAPMPCKILRVDISEGDKVQKNQALVVIESMKMETIIRSPQDGVVSKIMHQKGVYISPLA